MPKIKILDDEAARVLMYFGIDPEKYYKKMKTFGFIDYRLNMTKKEEKKREELKEEKKLIGMKVAEIDMRMKIEEGLICPVCLESLNGLAFHPTCNAQVRKNFHSMKKSSKLTRKTLKIINRRVRK